MTEVVELLWIANPVYGKMYLLPDGTLLDLTCFEKGFEDFWVWLLNYIDNSLIKCWGAKDYLWQDGWVRVDTKKGIIEPARFMTKEQEKRVKQIKELYHNVITCDF